MKEHIHTIPLNDAFLSDDECPFCFAERSVEERAIEFTVGSGECSYMDTDIRRLTNEQGFCREHMMKIYQYGNSLGNALILQTYIMVMLKEFRKQIEDFEAPEKKSMLSKFKKSDGSELPMVTWARNRQKKCFLCAQIDEAMARYLDTFFTMLKDAEFRKLVEGCKGFCMRHFTDILSAAPDKLPNAQREWFYPTLFRLMTENLDRIYEDVDWFTLKFDYRYADEPWKNSRDAVPRAMQKLVGIHPMDGPYKGKK